MNKKYKLDCKVFLDWYFSDNEDVLIIGKEAIKQLKAYGVSKITAKDLFNNCGTIPGHLIEDCDDESIEDLSLIELTEIIPESTKCHSCNQMTIVSDDIDFCVHCLSSL